MKFSYLISIANLLQKFSCVNDCVVIEKANSIAKEMLKNNYVRTRNASLCLFKHSMVTVFIDCFKMLLKKKKTDEKYAMLGNKGRVTCDLFKLPKLAEVPQYDGTRLAKPSVVNPGYKYKGNLGLTGHSTKGVILRQAA